MWWCYHTAGLVGVCSSVPLINPRRGPSSLQLEEQMEKGLRESSAEQTPLLLLTQVENLTK